MIYFNIENPPIFYVSELYYNIVDNYCDCTGIDSFYVISDEKFEEKYKKCLLKAGFQKKEIFVSPSIKTIQTDKKMFPLPQTRLLLVLKVE